MYGPIWTVSPRRNWKVRGREGEEDQARVGQVQNPLVPRPGQIEGGVPGALDAGDHMQEDGEQDVLLHDVGVEAKTRPV